jgi:hypothetical protein
VSKGNDRFTVENSDRLSIDISRMAKKEICILTGSGKKTCIPKKGKTIIRN